jgi:hypothetical protein
MEVCPQCQRHLPSDKRFCFDCGPLIPHQDSQPLQPPLPQVEGLRLRIVSRSGRACMIVPHRRAACFSPRLGPVAKRKIEKPFSFWCDIGIPLVALLFVITLMFALTEALRATGISLFGLAVIAVPLSGAIGAERIWLAGYWRMGLLGMLVSEGCIWALAAFFAVWPLF